MVLARRMYKVLPDELKDAVENNKLLIISMSNATRQSRATAMTRNKYVCDIADEAFILTNSH
jgi:hypothetical protein